MNKVILVGRLTAEPKQNEAKTVTKFSIAVDRKFKKDGEPTADFINCVAFDKPADFINRFFHKGMKIGITGRIQTGSYEKDGAKRYTTDVIIEEAEFVESKKAAEATNDGFVEIPDGYEENLPFK